MADATKTVEKRDIPLRGTPQGVKVKYPIITISGNYRTGGVAVTPASLNLKGIRLALFEQVIGATGADVAVEDILFYPQWDRVNSKIILIVASTGVELADDKDATGTAIYGIFVGY